MSITLAAEILDLAERVDRYDDGDHIHSAIEQEGLKLRLEQFCKQALRQMVLEAAKNELEKYNTQSRISIGERAWLTRRP